MLVVTAEWGSGIKVIRFGGFDLLVGGGIAQGGTNVKSSLRDDNKPRFGPLGEAPRELRMP